MTEAEIGYHRTVGARNAHHVGSVLTIVAAWMVAVVFLAWAILGLPVAVGESDLVHAAGRALLGVLVIGVVRLRRMAIGVALLLCLAVALYGAVRWITVGTPAPFQPWEILVAAVFMVMMPLGLWRVASAAPAASSAPQPPAARETRPSGAQAVASADAFGRLLANQVADLLQRGGEVGPSPRGSRGSGMALVNGRFVYDEMFAGRLACSSRQPPALEQALAVFSDRAAFVSWLADQSDRSLATPPAGGAGAGQTRARDYQGITRRSLERAVAAAAPGT